MPRRYISRKVAARRHARPRESLGAPERIFRERLPGRAKRAGLRENDVSDAPSLEHHVGSSASGGCSFRYCRSSSASNEVVMGIVESTGRERSKLLEKSYASASTFAKGRSPKLCSIKASNDANEATFESVNPRLANGLTITMGSLMPSPDEGAPRS